MQCTSHTVMSSILFFFGKRVPKNFIIIGITLILVLATATSSLQILQLTVGLE